jgi:cytidine deaminase
MPCGICRQILFDYAPELEVIALGEFRFVRATMRVLLPFAFEGPVLRK